MKALLIRIRLEIGRFLLGGAALALPVHFVWYIIIRYIICVVSMVPDSTARNIGRAFGRVMYRLDFKHRRIATKNLLRAGGMPKSDRDIQKLVRRVYEHFAMSAVEILLIPRMMARGNLVRHVKLINFHFLDEALKKGKGAVMISPHQGNWELGAIRISFAGYDMNSITRPVTNPFLHRYFLQFRTSTGHTLIPRTGAMRTMIECLKTNRIVVIQPDQNAHRKGVFVPFFGRPASTGKTSAIMSIKYGSPIIPIRIYRGPRGEHCIEAHAGMEPPKGLGLNAAVEKMTADFTRLFETWIRMRPEEWMWLHARWKTKPGREGGEKEGAGEEAMEPDGAATSAP